MSRYTLTQRDRIEFELRARYSAVAEPNRPGYLRLFNKNDFTTLFVKPIGMFPNRAVWVVECDDVPKYFEHVLQPVQEDDNDLIVAWPFESGEQ